MGQNLYYGRNYRSSFTSRVKQPQYWFLLTIILSASFLIFYRNNSMETKELKKTIIHKQKIMTDVLRENKHDTNYFDDQFTIHTEGCSIPAFEPLDVAIKQYVFHPAVKPCRNSTFPLLDNNRTHIWIKEENRIYYNKTISGINCCYISFYRPYSIDDVYSSGVDNRVHYNECIIFNKNIKVNDEFVKVECINNNTMVYEQFFLFTPVKKKTQKGTNKPPTSAYNVLVLGIDAVSRLNFHRTMPRTLNFLKIRDAVELLGYNKVGDNTFPNVIPMLLGIKNTELRKTCLPNSWSSFDNCPFIWDWFKQAGYQTAFGEDSSSLGTFNYFRAGFIGTPTDYYLHTFVNEAERNVGNNKDFNSFLCMNDKPFYKVLLNYIEDLAGTLKYTKLFGFFWETTISHDYLNYPMIADIDYERFLNNLHISKYLNETIIFLVSDHGLRWGEMRSTIQGRLEERLPFMYVLVPQSFRNNYREAYENLKLNSQRLTTPFDIHATLFDLVNLKNIDNEQLKARTLRPYGKNRSISLFLPIPRNRTCEIADIDDQWCTCRRSHKLSVKSGEALNAASQLLRHLNNLLVDYNQCATLYLVEIIDASEVELGSLAESKEYWREFMVLVRTEPGGALFEGTLRQNNLDWSLAGTISRLNLYGDQSRCISKPHLKLYCYCV